MPATAPASIACSITIQQLLSYLFPDGTLPQNEDPGGDRWGSCPPWPPDLFGFVATLAEQSGAYVEPGLVLSEGPTDRRNKIRRANEAKEIGATWRRQGFPPPVVQDRWAQLLEYRDHFMCTGMSKASAEWKRTTLELLAIADEAATGFGFVPNRNVNTLATLVLDGFVAAQRQRRAARGVPRGSPPHIPHSIANLIAPDRLCVLPKALTPQVGCNLRSLSHHLALLPGLGVVRPNWYIGFSPEKNNNSEPARQSWNDGDRFNIMLVPFPYFIGRSGFRPTCPSDAGLDGHFALDPVWMEHEGRRVTTDDLAVLISDLIHTTQQEVDTVHAVVFPETALPRSVALELAGRLAQNFPDELELFIAGVTHSDGGRMRNEALLARLESKERVASVFQSKHHRWRLDTAQIQQYQLGRHLPANSGWWEDIDVHNRELAFGLSRSNTVISALICEDLARSDPVLPVLNAIGPNLVIALLMDGPQLQARWPGRYATVLAEDPGSAVLTLTSIGMINLSRRRHEEPCRIIALWKDAGRPAVELLLPQGAHALTLSIEVKTREQYTMDLRSDNGTSVFLSLETVWPVVHPSPPKWVAEAPSRMVAVAPTVSKKRSLKG